MLNAKVEQDLGGLKALLRAYHENRLRLSDLELDALLGIEFWRFEGRIERQRYLPIDVYAGMELAQTSYGQIADFYHDVKPYAGDVIWEPGAMYAKLLIYGALLFEHVRFKGVELAEERVEEVTAIKKRLRLANLEVVAGNMFQMNYDEGTWFYLNLLKSNGLSRLLGQLALVGKKRVITITSLNGPTDELLETGAFYLWNDRYVRSHR